MTHFPNHTVETAPDGSKAALTSAQKTFGRIPSALGRLASSPTAVAAFNAGLHAFEHSALSLLERETVVFTIAARNGCHYCMAFHSQMLELRHVDEKLIAALRACDPLDDPKLEAVREFTTAVLEHRGAVPTSELTAFFAAGFTREQALDVVVGVGTYTLSTFANRLTDAPLDDALNAFAWHGCS